MIEISGFDVNGPFKSTPAPNPFAASTGDALAQTGKHIFHEVFTPGTGLGPLFNARSCVACHPGPGGFSTRDEDFVLRIARMDPTTGRVTTVNHPNSPVARRYSTRDMGAPGALPATLPRQANVTSLRMPLALYASGQLDEIPDAVIEAQAVSKGDGIKGRVHYVGSTSSEQKVGRYGWKAHAATLEEIVADAFATELGINSALAAQPQPPVEDDGRLVRAVAAYLRTLRIPRGLPR